jgi:hypothetical protein
MDQKAYELVLKARLLRLFARIFAVVGLIVFVGLYMKNVNGGLFSALTDPFVIVILVVPFLPAAVLSWKAARLEKQYIKKYGK